METKNQFNHITDLTKKEKIQWAISLRIENPENLKPSKLNAVLLQENLKKELRDFGSGCFLQSSF